MHSNKHTEHSPCESGMTESTSPDMTGNGEWSFAPLEINQFLSAAQTLLDKLIFFRPLPPAPPMKRVLNDLVLSEVLKSVILRYTGWQCDDRSEQC